MEADEDEGVERASGVDEDVRVDDELAFADVFGGLLSRSSLNPRDLAHNRADLAEKLKVDKQTIRTWEQGKRLPEDRQAVTKIATALELLDTERRELYDAWQRTREARDRRLTPKTPPAPEVATFTERESLEDAPAVRLPRTRRLPPTRPIIAAAALLAIVVVAAVVAFMHQSVASPSPHRLATRAFASVTKTGRCIWDASLTVTGLPPHAHVMLFSDYIGHSCNGTTYHSAWEQPYGTVGSSGTWSYTLAQHDYGTYRYIVVTDAGTRTPIDFHYGPQGNG